MSAPRNKTEVADRPKSSVLHPSTSSKEEDNLVDITDLIGACASSLSLQEPFLCRKETFQLQDAMAATQLMDPKMDSCEVPANLVLMSSAADVDNNNNGNSTRIMFPRPCPESLSDPFVQLYWNNLTLEQTAEIVMHQLVRIQAFFTGASVGESVFTCLYAHKPILCEMEQHFLDVWTPSQESSGASLLEVQSQALFEKASADSHFCAQLSLFASTCAMVEITEVFRSIVINADIYEEEDFVSNTHDMPFFLIDDKTILRQYLDTAVDILSHKLANHDEGSSWENTNSSQHIQKLQLGLTFLNGLTTYCSKMGKLRQTGLLETVQSMRRLASSLCEGLHSLTDLIACPKDTTRAKKETGLVAHVFDSYVNRPMFGNTPVRKVSFLSPRESISKLIGITEQLDWAVCGLLTNGTSLARIARMLRRFCSSSILARSLIVLNLYFDELLLGQHELQSLIIAHMRELEHLPTELVQNEHAQAFLSRLAKPVYDMLKLQVSNRNRQRAYIEAAMFQEWTSLQNEANLIDTQYRKERQLDNTTPPFFGHYVLSVLLRLMDQYLTCGIEVGLFCGHDEICSAFWYRDFLLAALIQNLTQMRRGKELYQAEEQAMQQQQMQETASSKGKGKKKNHHKNKTNTTQQQLPNKLSVGEVENGLELQVLEARRMLCRGIVRFIVAVRQSGLFELPTFEFTSRKTIFEKRYAVFSSIRHPPPLAFSDYLEGSDGSNISIQDLCHSAAAIFKACRALVESILADIGSVRATYAPVQESEARSLLKVCVGNSVYLMKLGQLVGGGDLSNGTKKFSFEFDFEAHKEFCIIKLR